MDTAAKATPRVPRWVRAMRGEGTRLPRWGRYVLAVVITAVALLIRQWILPVDGGFPFLTLAPAVALAALLLGEGPGVVVTALGALGADYFFIPPYGSLSVEGSGVILLPAFLVFGALICWMARQNRVARLAMRDSEQNLQGLFAAPHVGILRADSAGRILQFNESFRSMLGYEAAALRGMSYRDITPPEFAALDVPQAIALREAGRFGPYEKEFQRADGSRVTVELNGIRFVTRDGVEQTWTIVHDVSQRRAAALELASREARLRAVLAAMAEGLVVHAHDGQVVDANPAAEGILGLTRDQLLGRTSMDPEWQAIHEDGLPFPGELHPAMVTLRTGQPVSGQVMGVRAPGQGLRWISINSQPIPGAGGSAPAAVVATFTDITRQRQLTTDLRQAQADLQDVLDNVPARITSWRPDLTNRFANRLAEEQFGIPRGTAPGRRLREVIGEERYYMSEPYIAAALGGARQSMEVKDRQTDGTFRYARGEYVPEVRDGQVVGLFAMATDITDLRNSHQRIRDLVRRLEGVRNEERRAAAHQLHEGIAQDLAAVKFALGMLQGEAAGRSGVTEACAVLASAIDRCIESTRMLANDLQPLALAHLPLLEALQDHAALVAQRTGLRVSVAEIPPFPALDEPTKLVFFRAAQEALANAVRHARASTVFIVLRADPTRVVMEVSDDGVGINDADLVKQGALGLLGISEQFAVLGGGVDVARRERQGTTITFTLPPTAAGRAA